MFLFQFYILALVFAHVWKTHMPTLSTTDPETDVELEVLLVTPWNDAYIKFLMSSGCLSRNGTRAVNYMSDIGRYGYFAYDVDLTYGCLAATAVGHVVDGVVTTCKLKDLREVACQVVPNESSNSSSSSSSGIKRVFVSGHEDKSTKKTKTF